MVISLAQEKSSFTYDDYRAFPDGARCEILNGKAYDMTPAPSTLHQAVTLRIAFLLEKEMESKGHPCRIFVAPTDVILSQSDVVQPDVLIVCDRSKIREAGIFGAPEVIFEVISPGTETRDRNQKRDLFERFGIEEYFLVNPEREYLEKYTLDGGTYKKSQIYSANEKFLINVIGMELIAKDVFALPE